MSELLRHAHACREVVGLGSTPFGDPAAKVGSQKLDGSIPLAQFQQEALEFLRLSGANSDVRVHMGRREHVVDPRLVAAARFALPRTAVAADCSCFCKLVYHALHIWWISTSMIAGLAAAAEVNSTLVFKHAGSQRSSGDEQPTVPPRDNRLCLTAHHACFPYHSRILHAALAHPSCCTRASFALHRNDKLHVQHASPAKTVRI